MVASSSEFQTKVLRRSFTPDEYKIYRAALDWDLDDPIVIETQDDFKSEYRWRDQLKPYHHQVTNLITFCRRLPVTLLADDVGLGKTISAGLVASELISRSRVSKILIVCPKILGPQWKDELETKFKIPAEFVTGSDLIDAEPKEVGAVITTYHSARAHLEKIPENRFEMLVLDEAHKLRNLYGVETPPKVAVRFRDALEKRRFRYVLMLTATPIHNRLWDLYSLVDLLTVARGHQNPFGSQGAFARKFIADDRDKARHLKLEAKDEFRSIVYGYMSRVRRADAKLYFPDREVFLHKVEPSQPELDLIKIIAEPIQKLNILAQISILQALVSSPHALMAQLNNMSSKGTVPPELAASVRAIVEPMRTSAKLSGLSQLVEQLRRDNPQDWRVVVFTTRRETQTTIQTYLEGQGIPVGIINGDSGQRNQETIGRFKNKPDTCRVIISTEAGSEGVNLQVANVLVNYDLPWNPMIVEQRIGRVQRLASEHAKVSILNIILEGTFEEYIVGRLMEKLQMASHAIGDIDALLEASGVSDDEDGGEEFEKKILKLVLAALAKKDWEKATAQAVQSIENAEAELKREKDNIDAMLGGMDGAEYVGPRAPKLSEIVRSMEAREFIVSALGLLGAKVSEHLSGICRVESNGGREFIRFEGVEGTEPISTLYAPGSPAFMRLTDKVVATGIHDVTDIDRDVPQRCNAVVQAWASEFGAAPIAAEISEVKRCFQGKAIVRVRATVAHDSYERLVEVSCAPESHNEVGGRTALTALPQLIEDARIVGVNIAELEQAAKLDPDVSEFCRFYLERRDEEIISAGGDARKRKKLEDEFTPRLGMTLVGLEGEMYRRVKISAKYKLDGVEYTSSVEVVPHTASLGARPIFGHCALSGQSVPADCLGRCDITGDLVLRHRLLESELSGRRAIPAHVLTCSVSGRRVLADEAGLSDVSGKPVCNDLLKTSLLSGKKAEAKYFTKCDFTGAEFLPEELTTSQVSGRRFRIDEGECSAISGRTGHRSEFLRCYETRQLLLPDEGEKCEVTGHFVQQGVLEQCAVSQRWVLSSELETCAATGRSALRKFMVTSSVSGNSIIRKIAVVSRAGKFCSPTEVKMCEWSGKRFHPEDIKTCQLIGLPIHIDYCTNEPVVRLKPLVDILDGAASPHDASNYWDLIELKLAGALRSSNCRIEVAQASPDSKYVVACAEVRSMLGLKKRHVGVAYSIDSDEIVGQIVIGKRDKTVWELESSL